MRTLASLLIGTFVGPFNSASRLLRFGRFCLGLVKSLLSGMTLKHELPGSTKRKRNTKELHATPSPPQKRQLRISIPPSVSPALHDTLHSHNDDTHNTPTTGSSDPNSLFDEPTIATSPTPRHPPALLTAPPIQGLFFTPSLRLPTDVADTIMQYCLDTYFQDEGVNQVMLFGRFLEPTSVLVDSDPPSPPSGLPPILRRLLVTLESMLLPVLPLDTHNLLFPRVPTQARQAILNLYQPGEGISPHVDLLKRFGDGIIGVSLGSGCTMQFARSKPNEKPLGDDPGATRDRWGVYLPERSVIVLSEDARYGWTHGIDRCTQDYVASALEAAPGTWIDRGVRLSITFRWLLPGGDIVGDDLCESNTL